MVLRMQVTSRQCASDSSFVHHRLVRIQSCITGTALDANLVQFCGILT